MRLDKYNTRALLFDIRENVYLGEAIHVHIQHH